MKTRLAGKLFAVALLAGVLGLAPTLRAEAPSAADLREETRELIQALKGYGVEKRDEAVEKTRAVLEKLDDRIASLRSQLDKHWYELSESARKKAKENLEVLRQQRSEVAEWYGRMKDPSADAWDDMRQGFSRAFSSLREAWEKAEKEFQTDK